MHVLLKMSQYYEEDMGYLCSITLDDTQLDLLVLILNDLDQIRYY